MSEITISDIGHTLVMMDQELDRLDAEQLALSQQLDISRERAKVIKAAMRRLLDTRRYAFLTRT